ncbi:GAP family protein [Brachybacterium sp. YJGR34]|uniref:GAP family protein n=1 Tax=Brachybacterium sp. YJGR34 TaxID=2059911 RepID=UPI000E0A31D0|nr:GAP family protein [Brachybacterium sp. YJGR34]
MSSALGDVLPLALGVAISPIPIIAAILMLLSPKARTTSVGFLIGWIAGIVVAISLFTLLSSVLPEQDPDAAQPIKGVIQLLLGALLFVIAAKQWGKRPQEGEEAALPTWMKAIDTFTLGKALGLGFLLSAVNPKNLIMAAGAGVTVGSASLSAGSTITVLAVFTVLAASTVAVPVVGYLLAADRLRGVLDALRTWLARENAVIMAVLLLVIGISMIGKGIGSF